MSAVHAGSGLTLGILGGMGPQATVDLMQRIIAATPARDDQDHIRLLVDNNPQVPSRIAALIDGDGPSPLPALLAMARGLQAQGAGLLAMPCNTAHHYHADVARAVSIPFLNMMELAVGGLHRAQPKARRVGLLGSSALRKIGLYEPWLHARGKEALYPDAAAQTELMALIRAVKAGRKEPWASAALAAAARSLHDAGAQALLIACTELSVLADALAPDLPLFDAAELLARGIVERVRSLPGPEQPAIRPGRRAGN